MSASPSEVLPVNVKNITDKRHIIFRLDKLQREILANPERFVELDDDPSLNHVRKEVQALQQALTQVVKSEARFELQALQRTGQLLKNWAGENELHDTLLLDNHRRENFQLKFETGENYLDWRHLSDQMREERLTMFSRYRGYFESLDAEVDTRKAQNEAALLEATPQMEEWRKISEPLLEVQQQINYYTQQANKFMVGGFGALIGLTLLGHFSGIWGGWLWGLILGYNLFQTLIHRYAYVTGKPMWELFEFLKSRYEFKKVRPFFQFEQIEIPPEPEKEAPPKAETAAPIDPTEKTVDPEPTEASKDKKKSDKPKKPTKKYNYDNPLRYDASRGEVLANILQKDILEAQKAFLVLERKREEHKGYLNYLEGRRRWYLEQLRKMDEIEAIQYQIQPLEQAKKPKSQKPKVPVTELPASESQTEPAKPEAPVSTESFAPIPPVPEQEIKVTRKTSRRAMKVRPADLGTPPAAESDASLTPERAS